MADISYEALDQLVDSESELVGRFRLVEIDSIDSTNTYLAHAATHGAQPGLVVCARSQSAGRGRRDRSWIDKPGESLLFSILFNQELNSDGVAPVSPAVFGQLVSLAVVEAADGLGVEVGLKWPNDLQIKGKKLAGVLGESLAFGGRLSVIVGCGLNLNWPSESSTELPDVVSLSEAAGADLDRSEVIRAILKALDALMVTFADNPETVRSLYEQRCTSIGAHLRVQLEDRTFFGKGVGVDEQGALRVQTSFGIQVVNQADVVHVRPTDKAHC